MWSAEFFRACLWWLRAFWPGYVLQLLWICGFVLVFLVKNQSDRRLLRKLFLWCFPLVLLMTAWVSFLIVMFARGPVNL
jgi:hypothetical protein